MFLTLKDMVRVRRSPENTLLQQPGHYIPKPCVTLHRERECKNAPGTVGGGKTRTEHRKVIVRSSYFKDKSISEHNQEKRLLKDDLAIDMHKDAVPESTHFENSYFNRKVAKRKTSPHDNVQVVCVFLSFDFMLRMFVFMIIFLIKTLLFFLCLCLTASGECETQTTVYQCIPS